ncbi:MAG: 3-deoxy-7-phosphoheptulonate synthase [Opitutus sp.]|nr:3-deoxy-7-phosphoheptulonate synthase [Opitutus sp.]MCS6248562.1 3-deoxy-7-phosphoheptulonate synthase [Opitutus sp.]MCS6275335.1 3-deoxy-7-phosphoheptulonate synthase [Opitutus sp.]MCS6276839.1 3-deoxy-7-phosphoheptulonate synthase [Opitutus sp.]MCS6301512.1 3-deoxy-7-phosphoheptulonate synthase [Opitutus sp.]
MHKTSDINVVETRPLPSPAQLLAALPKNEAQADFITRSRDEINRLIFTSDRRFLLIIGPCSIHDVEAGRQYARRLAALASEVSDRIMVVMRVYFEKPRTTVGWKGLVMDPHLDGSHDIAAGLRLGRSFLGEVLDLGLPTATEFLDPITPQYIADLVCWGAIGARTTESQTHRQLASGLSMAIGFKNGTDGNLQTAVNAIKAAGQPQTFLGVSLDGAASAIVTRGNPNCHIVLRGGSAGPNYSAEHITKTEQALVKGGLTPSILVDASHDNSAKKPELQPDVIRVLLEQIAAGNTSIMGAMVESNLESGSQSFPQPKESLRFGVSITDGCIGWDTTEKMVREIHAALAPHFA